MSDPTPAFNEVVHSPVRLRVAALLRRVGALEFSVVRDTLGVTDAHLSKNLKVLSDAGLIEVRKEASHSRNDSRRLTWVSLTDAGRDAINAHLAALAALAGD